VNESLKELADRLAKTVFSTSITAKNKPEVLAQIADILVENGKVAPDQRDAVHAALVEREGKMSTGMQYGVAIPHAKTDAVDQLVSIIALAQEAIEFDALDGAPSNIFVATLSPRADANSHIKFLAEVSRQLASRRVREKLLAATSADEMIEAICGPKD
jgi:mannitol/fructose-specific phosphotransferase system IIA component (Ntr-type)